MENHAENVYIPKASPRSFFYFGKKPKTAIAYNNFFQK